MRVLVSLAFVMSLMSSSAASTDLGQEISLYRQTTPSSLILSDFGKVQENIDFAIKKMNIGNNELKEFTIFIDSINDLQNNILEMNLLIESQQGLVSIFKDKYGIIGPVGCQDAICLDEEFDDASIGIAATHVVLDKCRDAICIDELLDLGGMEISVGDIKSYLPDGCEYAICLEQDDARIVIEWGHYKKFIGGCIDSICIDAGDASSSADKVKKAVKDWAEKAKKEVDNTSASESTKKSAKKILDEVIDLVDD